MRHIAIILFILLPSLAGRAEETVVELLTIGPGEQFFQVHGHAALRVISDDCDSVYSFETDPGRSAVMQYLAGNRGKIVAESSSRLLDSIGATGRGLNAYTLNLTSVEAGRLHRQLRDLTGQRQSRFNMRSANCTTQLFDLIDSAVTPTRISPGQSPVFTLRAARFYTDTISASAPWVTALITMALGAASDDQVTTARSISPVLFDDQYRHFTMIPDGRPLVANAREIHPRQVSLSPPSITPTAVATALALLLLAASLLSILKIKSEIATTIDNITFGIIFLLGALIAFATFSPYSVGNGRSWSLTVINPLIVCLPALYHRCPKGFRLISLLWAAWLLVFALFGPCFTAESLSAVRILAAALALRLLTLKYTNSALNLAGWG